MRTDDAFALRLQALQARGHDPVRLRRLQALARRAAGCRAGALRTAIERRLQALLAAEEARPACRSAPEPPAGAAPGPLGGLLAHLSRQSHALADGDAHGRAAFTAPGPFRRAWARLGARQRIAQSRSALPAHAGPLNSHQLVHEALTRLAALSPGYLERFVAQVDALLWLEASAAARPATAKRPR